MASVVEKRDYWRRPLRQEEYKMKTRIESIANERSQFENTDDETQNNQRVVFDILVNFDTLCRQHNLRYYLAYGTLLGGVRSQGFIPWDDDLDVWMPREDYTRLLEIVERDDHAPYTLSSINVSGAIPLSLQGKYVNKSLICDRIWFGQTVVVHPWIDIFILDVFPHKKAKVFLSKAKIYSVIFNLCRLRNMPQIRKEAKGLHKLIYNTNVVLHQLDLFGEKRSERLFLQQLTRYDDGDRLFSFASVYMNKMNKCTFERDWFGEPQYHNFEGRMFPFPENYDSILTRIYGDYMTPPPPEKRIAPHGITNIRKVEGVQE